MDKGSWGSWSRCPKGHYVEAVRTRKLEPQDYGYGPGGWGGWGGFDDSALNGIRLRCSNGLELTSAEGYEGYWSSWSYAVGGLTAVNMRSEPRDSWAAAAIKFSVRTEKVET